MVCGLLAKFWLVCSSLTFVGASIRLAGVGSPLFAVEVTLSRCDVRGLFSSCDKGDILQFWWVGSSLIVACGLLVAVASLIAEHRL